MSDTRRHVVKSILMNDFHHQLPQQASKPHRFRTQLLHPTSRHRHHFYMQPHLDIAQGQGHINEHQPQGRVPATRAYTRLLHLTIGRLNTKLTPVHGANPAQEAMLYAPRDIPQGSRASDGPDGPTYCSRPPPGQR